MKKILVIGSFNMDYVVDVFDHPANGETILANSLKLICGGKGANQAYTLGKLGANVKMMGCVGKDDNGSLCKQNLQNVNVDVSSVQETNNPTGMAIISVNHNGDNSIIVVPGSNTDVTVDFVKSNIEHLQQCDIVLLQLEIPMKTVEFVIDRAKQLGKTVVVDPAPANQKITDELMSKIDIIKPNINELSQLTNMSVTKETVPQACKVLQQKGVGCILATLGGDGVYVLTDDQSFWIDSIPVDVKDTTAAGDSFIASVVYYLSIGKSLKEAVVFANKVASIVVTKDGAQTSIPSINEIK